MSELQQSASFVARHRRALRWLAWIVAAICVAAILLFVAAMLIARHIQPFLKQRAVEAVANEFHAHVELDRLDFFPREDWTVTGGGLRITPIGLEAYPPAIVVRSFQFHIRPWDLLNPTRHVRFANVEGLVITLPPGPKRMPSHPAGVSGNHSKLIIDAFVCKDAQIILLHDQADKPPTVFNIHRLKVTTPLFGGAPHYDAYVENPVPHGEIHSTGTFGPWSNADPRTTPVTGDFTFTHADLSTIKGIAGILNSKGHFSGPLDELTVDGTTETPDFQLANTAHPLALYTTYHAKVDGTNGDVDLEPVQAHFRNTYFTCSGKVANIKGQGHDISLDVQIQRGRIEDVLWLAVRSAQPLMTGALTTHSHLHIPPDPSRSTNLQRRMTLSGQFHLSRVSFSNPETDRTIDEVSLRTQGKPDEAKQLSDQQGRDDVALTSTMFGDYSMADAVIHLHPATFEMPGIQATMNGTYSLDGQTMNISGNARLSVPISKMETGWKSFLLKAVDPLFKKNGAPAVIPFRVTGPRQAPEFSVQIMKGLSIGVKKAAQK